MSEKKQNVVISEELAIQEVIKFINNWSKKLIKSDVVLDEYPDVVNAVKDGNLTFDSKLVPTLKLRNPIKTDEGSVVHSQINFKTRVKPTIQANLAEGLNLQKQSAKYMLRIVAYIIGLESVPLIDKFEKEDYDAIQQLSSVFM